MAQNPSLERLVHYIQQCDEVNFDRVKSTADQCTNWLAQRDIAHQIIRISCAQKSANAFRAIMAHYIMNGTSAQTRMDFARPISRETIVHMFMAWSSDVEPAINEMTGQTDAHVLAILARNHLIEDSLATLDEIFSIIATVPTPELIRVLTHEPSDAQRTLCATYIDHSPYHNIVKIAQIAHRSDSLALAPIFYHLGAMADNTIDAQICAQHAPLLIAGAICATIRDQVSRETFIQVCAKHYQVTANDLVRAIDDNLVWDIVPQLAQQLAKFHNVPTNLLAITALHYGHIHLALQWDSTLADSITSSQVLRFIGDPRQFAQFFANKPSHRSTAYEWIRSFATNRLHHLMPNMDAPSIAQIALDMGCM